MRQQALKPSSTNGAASRGVAAEGPGQQRLTALSAALNAAGPSAGKAGAVMQLSPRRIAAIYTPRDERRRLYEGHIARGLDETRARDIVYNQLNTALADARGLVGRYGDAFAAFCHRLLGQYPTGQYAFVGIGASAELICSILRQLQAHVFMIPLSSVKGAHLTQVRQNPASPETLRLQKFLRGCLGAELGSARRMVLMDVVDQGNTLLLIKELVEQMQPHKNVTMLSLNSATKGLHGMEKLHLGGAGDPAHGVSGPLSRQDLKTYRVIGKYDIKNVINGTRARPDINRKNAFVMHQASRSIAGSVRGLIRRDQNPLVGHFPIM